MKSIRHCHDKESKDAIVVSPINITQYEKKLWIINFVIVKINAQTIPCKSIGSKITLNVFAALVE